MQDFQPARVWEGVVTPDEFHYQALAQIRRVHGLRATSAGVVAALPSPARWLWTLWVSLFPSLSPWPSRVFALLQPWSVIAAWSGRRYLQDGAVSFFTVAAILLARYQSGPWWQVGLALAVFLMLSVKEGAVIFLWGVLCAGPGWSALGGIAAGLVLWFLVGLGIFRSDWVRMLRAAGKGHDTEYQKTHQNSAPLTLGLLFALAPVVLVIPMGQWALPAAGLVVGYMWSPVKNTRLLGALETLGWLTVVQESLWMGAIPFAMAHIGNHYCLSRPGTGWKDERGTVDLVPMAIVEAVSK